MSVKPEHEYPEKIVIGTRGSPLALWQSETVKAEIEKVSPKTKVSLKIIRTSGDWKPEDGEVRLDALEGGKAQFAKEIEEALLAKDIDIAVHSMKDMETSLPEGLCIPFMLPRADVRDGFLSNKSQKLCDLPMGSVVGTASVRRAAFVLNKRPDLKVVPFRGNVQTRIDKLKGGQVDATFLACAGLSRLGMLDQLTSVIDVDDMLPAVGQGAIGIEMRECDARKLSFFSQFSCVNSFVCVSCERAVLSALGGSCQTPIGVYALLEDGEMHLRAKLISPDGRESWMEERRAQFTTVEAACVLGNEVGALLKSKAPAGVLG